MWWLAAAQIGMSALSSMNSSGSAAAQENAAKIDAMRQRTQDLEDMTARNEAGIQANVKNMVSAGIRSSLVTLNMAQRARQFARETLNAGIAENEAIGSASANAAASGTIGSSVDAVQSDILMKMQRARFEGEEQYQTDTLNAQQQLNDIFENLDRGLYTPQIGRTNATSLKLSKGQDFGQALLGAGTQFAGNYAMQNMSLGLGKPGNTTTALNSAKGMGGTLEAFMQK